jgi:hypothetical protein
MFIIKDKNNNIIAYCSRYEDAEAIASSASVDKQEYLIESLK